jgi:hypothetical protein
MPRAIHCLACALLLCLPAGAVTPATAQSDAPAANSRGEFPVRPGTASFPVEPAGGAESVTVRAKDKERTFPLKPTGDHAPRNLPQAAPGKARLRPLNGNASSLISISAWTDNEYFMSGDLYASASLTAWVVDTGGNPVNGATVTWSVHHARNNSPAMMAGWESKKTGLTWGNAPESGNGGQTYAYQRLRVERIVSATNNTSATNSFGKTTMQFTDIMGEGIIAVQAKVTIDGTDHTATEVVSFYKGPLSMLLAPWAHFLPR